MKFKRISQTRKTKLFKTSPNKEVIKFHIHSSYLISYLQPGQENIVLQKTNKNIILDNCEYTNFGGL